MDYKALAKALENVNEWQILKNVLLNKIDELNTVDDIDCSKFDVAVEVRARQHAKNILIGLINDLTYKDEKIVDKDHEARCKHGLD